MIKKLFSINQVKKAACDAINNGAIYNEPCLFSISGIIKPSEKNIYYLVMILKSIYPSVLKFQRSIRMVQMGRLKLS